MFLGLFRKSQIQDTLFAVPDKSHKKSKTPKYC